MLRLLKRARGRSLNEWVVRGSQAARTRFERLGLRLAGARNETPFNPELGARLREMPLFSKQAAEAIRAIALRDPEVLKTAKQRTIEMAGGKVTLLGCGPVFVGHPPDWHREPIAGKSAPLKHWSLIPYLDASQFGDHKLLWEFNRHQYLYAPAITWLDTGEPEYFELIQQHLASWLERNPRYVGINWASSLEVAYRALTWCWLVSLLRSAPWDETLLAKMAASLEHHALHVEHHLSLYFSPNTHLTGEALALFCLGSALPASAHSRRWRARGAQILESCLSRHVAADGVYFEQATQYHRYTAEIYLQYFLAARSAGWRVSALLPEALGKLFDVLRSIADGAGRMPLIGDDDGGLLLPFDHYPPDDLNGLLLAGAVALGRPDLCAAGPAHPALSYLMNGVATTESLTRQPLKSPAWTPMYFASGGLAVMRDGWGPDDAVCTVDAGPHGAMNCGHAHADALAMTLTLGQQPVLVDRGTLTYIGDMRNEFRSTASHNTLEFDGESAVTPLAPFQWGPRPKRPTASLRVHNQFSMFRGRASGHEGTGRASVHDRLILHVAGGCWIVLDKGTRAVAKRAVVRWQFAPGLKLEKSSERCFDIKGASGEPVVRALVAQAARSSATMREVSTRYGARSEGPLLEVTANDMLGAVLILLPAIALEQFTDVTSPTDNSRSFAWTDGSGTHALRFAAGIGDPLELSGWTADADLLWHITSTFGNTLMCAGARRLITPDGEQLVPHNSETNPRDVVVGRVAEAWAILPVLQPQRGWE